MTPFEGDPDEQGPVFGYTEAEIVGVFQRADSAGLEVVRLNEERQDLLDVIRDALKVLHKTAVSKKKVADRMRAALGLLPGERVQ